MRLRYPLIILAGTAAMNAALAAVGDDTWMPHQQAHEERSFDPSVKPDGQRNPTGEGVGTSTGTPADMGPDNRMQIKDATRDGNPGVGVKPVTPTPPPPEQPMREGQQKGGTGNSTGAAQ